jgi:hypothetical protein
LDSALFGPNTTTLPFIVKSKFIFIIHDINKDKPRWWPRKQQRNVTDRGLVNRKGCAQNWPGKFGAKIGPG